MSNDRTRKTVVQTESKPRSVVVTALQLQTFSERERIKQGDESYNCKKKKETSPGLHTLLLQAYQ